MVPPDRGHAQHHGHAAPAGAQHEGGPQRVGRVKEVGQEVERAGHADGRVPRAPTAPQEGVVRTAQVTQNLQVLRQSTKYATIIKRGET